MIPIALRPTCTMQVVQKAVCPEYRIGLDTAVSAVASVAEVKLTGDLQMAKVYISIYSDELGKVTGFRGLKRLERCGIERCVLCGSIRYADFSTNLYDLVVAVGGEPPRYAGGRLYKYCYHMLTSYNFASSNNDLGSSGLRCIRCAPSCLWDKGNRRRGGGEGTGGGGWVGGGGWWLLGDV